MTFLNPAYVITLPEPMLSEKFSLIKRGVYDDASVDVYANSTGDFALLAPPPKVDYCSYKPRHQSLGLTEYKKARRVIESRYSKIESCFNDASSVLEIGAAEGAFLAHLRAMHSDLALAAIEPDESTRQQRDAITGLQHFATLEAAVDSGLTVDAICLFHVFEHLTDPAEWLSSARRLLTPGGKIIIEVPSLDDPLLSLFRLAAYRNFYFQRQHPFVYSAASLRRVLEYNGFSVDIIPYQRYGMENHLAWLSKGKPGGNAEFGSIFGCCETDYIEALEARGLTDTVFAIAKAVI
jgi:SAM-dependent methyltransferase